MMIQQMQQVLDMHTLINKRPFFSIIVPCYNSRKTIGQLLSSLLTQNLEKDDMEIIISDDCSTESYQDIIDQFTNQLNIIQTKTDYNCCPGNTRQRGVEQAIGEWICFADHDDFFVADALHTVKQAIQQNNYNTMIVTDFYKKDYKTNQLAEMSLRVGWTHGKFFNLDNFWKKYNLYYPKDLMSNEDICVCIQASFLQQLYDIPVYQINIPTYIWVEHPSSLSNKFFIQDNEERTYLDIYFIDYIEATAGTYYRLYHQYGKQLYDFVANSIKEVILYAYYYFEDGRNKNPNYLEKNCYHIKKYLKILKDQFNISIDDIYNYYKYINPDYYKEMYNIFITQIEIFLFEQSFKEWLYWIWDEKFVR